MSLRINLNAAALNAHRQLQNTDRALAASIEKLSSGFRINRAADDPAGLAISENLRAQVSGLGQAISNSSDAVNLIRTAEGALAEIHNLLRTMRNLALHAANVGANDDTAIAADQAQIDSAVTALDRIATNTQFGTKVLLNGDGLGGPLSLIFQIGANSGQTTTVTIDGVSSTVLGVDTIDVAAAPDLAIDAVDIAISTVSTMRASLGATQQDLESNIASLSVAKENIAASESSIRDADMALEMVQFTRSQILLQAGTAMLTQANAAPQALLSLLR
ncbi:MAG TPA: flagellin [Armatimonadota bacterium]|nr:flagellin [Armatimonadota bacterium]